MGVVVNSVPRVAEAPPRRLELTREEKGDNEVSV
jgi:hypothetical protein